MKTLILGAAAPVFYLRGSLVKKSNRTKITDWGREWLLNRREQ